MAQNLHIISPTLQFGAPPNSAESFKQHPALGSTEIRGLGKKSAAHGGDPMPKKARSAADVLEIEVQYHSYQV